MRHPYPTANLSLLAEREPDALDLREAYHEVSKNRRSAIAWFDVDASDRLLQEVGAAREELLREVYQQIARSHRTARHADKVSLPLAAQARQSDLFDVIEARRSTRSFTPEPLRLAELGELLRLTYGITHASPAGDAISLQRAAPSAGGIYELELYVGVRHVEGVAAGLYRYEARGHQLALVKGGDAVGELDARTVVSNVDGAAVVIVFTVVLGRLEWKYEQRSYRLALLDAGHAAEHVALTAEALGLGSCFFQGFIDDEIAEYLEVDGVSEIPIHMAYVGRPRAAPTHACDHEHAAEPETGVLRRDGIESRLAHGCHRESWTTWDDRLRRAFAGLGGDRERARAELIALRAMLPDDRTLADYLELADQPSTVIATTADALFAFDPALTEEQRTRWMADVERAIARAKAWFAVDRIPATFVDLRGAAALPTTHVEQRPVQRRIVLPSRVDFAALCHEIVHALVLPHDLVIAEGLATVVALDETELREMDACVALQSHAPSWLLECLGRGSVPDGERDALLYPAAASFVSHLIRTYGKARLLALLADIRYPLPDGDPHSRPCALETAFGRPRAELVAHWWASVSENGGAP